MLKMHDIMTKEAYKSLTADHRRAILRREQVAELSGFRGNPQTCSAILAQIPANLWDTLTVGQLSDVAKAINAAYHNGRADKAKEQD